MSRTASVAALVFATISSLCLPMYAAEAAKGEIDYVAKLNELAGPTGDPKDNAAPFYEKAFELAVPEPNELTRDELTAWPDDLTKEKLQALTKWWADNTRALTELKQGATRAYWSREYVGNHLWDILPPNLAEMRALTRAICARAKLKAARGDFAGSFADIVTAKQFVSHIGQCPTLVEQLVGIAFRALAANTTLDILARTEVTSASLKELDKLLAGSRYGVLTVFDLRCETLYACEAVDTLLYYDENGELHLDEYPLLGGLTGSNQPLAETFKKCDKDQREELKAKIGKYYVSMQTEYSKTPWETNEKSAELVQQELEYMKSNPAIALMSPAFSTIAQLSWRSKAYEDAVTTVAVLLRYKQQKARLPESLDELVKAGYLKEVPRDPYGPAPLTYKTRDNDFLLYSWAGDFDDDGGTPSDWGRDGGDQVFWPVQKR